MVAQEKTVPIDNILGYSVASLLPESCCRQIQRWIEAGDKQKVFVCANPHSLVIASGDKEFQQAIHTADLVTPDGVGIIIASKILGGTIRKRVTGSDVFKGLSGRLNDVGGKSYFFLGSSKTTLARIKDKMVMEYPDIYFAGSYSPPYKSVFTDDDSRAMIEAVNGAKPDVLWVGMTAPKQEKWIYLYRERLDVKFIGAIGAVFDFYVGNVKRSHPFFQRMGLEWFPRLIQEPRRLFRRNFISSPLFLLQVLVQRLRQ